MKSCDSSPQLLYTIPSLLFSLFLSAFAVDARELLSNLTREQYGVYWSELRVGSPPQSFSVLMDTGSSLTALPCANCDTCGPTHRRWNVSESTTAKKLYVEDNARYMEGSYINSTLVEDEMCVDGDVCVAPYPVGCTTAESRAFRKQTADGIMGLYGRFVDSVGAFSMCFPESKFDVGMPHDGSRYAWYPIRGDRAYALSLVSVGDVDARGWVGLIDSGSTGLVLPRRMRNRAIGAGLCELQFEGGPLIKLDPCIPHGDIAEDEGVIILGTSFFHRVPRIVFTSTHIGMGVEGVTCGEEEGTDFSNSRGSPWNAVGVLVAYALALGMGVNTFLIVDPSPHPLPVPVGEV